MCFRPATTTMGARICKSCYMVCDDVTAVDCPNCGAKFEPPAEGGDVPPTAPSASPAAPGAPQAPQAPKA